MKKVSKNTYSALIEDKDEGILNNNKIFNTYFLPYQYNEQEINLLKELNKNEKIYDFGIICYSPDINESIRKQRIITFLKKSGFTVNIICGWKHQRDYQLSICKVILNIHSSKINTSEECCMIFEHIRCDRLLNSGYNILSEETIYLEEDFIHKYPNLRITNFDNLLEINFYKHLDWLNITK